MSSWSLPRSCTSVLIGLFVYLGSFLVVYSSWLLSDYGLSVTLLLPFCTSPSFLHSGFGHRTHPHSSLPPVTACGRFRRVVLVVAALFLLCRVAPSPCRSYFQRSPSTSFVHSGLIWHPIVINANRPIWFYFMTDRYYCQSSLSALRWFIQHYYC